jgi:hypothetical protein
MLSYCMNALHPHAPRHAEYGTLNVARPGCVSEHAAVPVNVPCWLDRGRLGTVYGRDNAMRTELETQLLFCAPRELLLVGELSGRTRKLLDAYAAPASGVRSEPVDRWVCSTISLLVDGTETVIARDVSPPY